MLSGLKAYLKPQTLEEAYELAQDNTSIYVSGGLMVAALKSSRIEKIIDLKSLGMNEVEDGESVKVGANVKLSEFMQNPILSEMYGGFFHELMKEVGSTQIRNMATVGGSVAFRLGWSDVITALMVAETDVEIFNGESKRMPIEDYLTMKRGKEIVTAVYIPKKENRFMAFEKFSKSTFDIATLNVGVSFEIQNGNISKAVIAVGSRPMISERVEEVEDFLEGKSFTPSLVDETASKIREVIKVGNDIRATAEYRKALAGSLLKKCMRRIENESHI
jgi:CO/xanthine dehydrogenase FAD-binding subunit